MQVGKNVVCGVLALAMAASAAEPASATTLIRQSLAGLVGANETVIVGEVLDTDSYWNQDKTFILTDVRIKATEILKGDPRDTELTVTILGGSVDDLTTLIVGGAELIPGQAYVLFVDKGDLPGARAVRTIEAHSQGVFEIVKARDGVRAISQANRHPLYPDALGFVDPPGGAKGLLLRDMIQSVREIAGRQRARQEVQ
jgi:hypothetical protein